MFVETEEGFVKVCSQRPVMIDQTLSLRHDVHVDDIILPSVMITRFTQLKHFVKVIVLHPYFCYLLLHCANISSIMLYELLLIINFVWILLSSAAVLLLTFKNAVG